MSIENFVLLRLDKGEVAGIAPSVNHAEQAVVTVQSQGVYLYNVRGSCKCSLKPRTEKIIPVALFEVLLLTMVAANYRSMIKNA